jgi:adenine-specific DNA-methyltransferase
MGKMNGANGKQSKPTREKVARESSAIVPEQIERLKELFPEAVSEGKVDFDRLRQTLGEFADDRPERYSFTWAGKRDCIKLLQVPSRATLVPSPDESIDWDTTNNVFIEGENLEVLKLLYKAYYGRVKMIYIDPPYNTGKDFIYPDNYADPLDTYLRLTGQKDSEGNVLTSNPETSGRYHSSWLSMMYPRLFVARQLLRDDGVLFASINDKEASHLRLMLNEVFGEEQFIAAFVWKSRHNVDSRDESGVSRDHEYVLCYGKRVRGEPKDLDKYSNPDNDPRGPWMSDNMVGLATKDRRPNLHYDLVNPETGISYECPEKGWRFDRGSMARKIAEKRVLWPSSPTGRPRHKKFMRELKSDFTGFSTLLSVPTTSEGTQELRDLFGMEVFEFPKPTGMIKVLVEQAAGDGDVVVDFFAGACPAAQAVLAQNQADGLQRQFVMVQLPEPTQPGSQARTLGLKSIADIGKDRIRRVVAKMKKEQEGKLATDGPQDLGFRVYKLAESNMKPWKGTGEKDPEKYAKTMEMFLDPLVDGWKTENVIAELALKEAGFGLNCRVEEMKPQMNADGRRLGSEPKPKTSVGVNRRASAVAPTVYRVTDEDKEQFFYICLDDRVRLEDVKFLNLTRDMLFVCRDVALDDEAAANLALQCRLRTI